MESVDKTFDPVVTVTTPVKAPVGTVARMYVEPVKVFVVAAAPPNLTTDDELNPCPRMPTCAPSVPDVTFTSEMNGLYPLLRL